MSKDFKDLNSLFAHLEKNIRSALKQEVAEIAVRTLQENVVEEVYEKYTPKVYERLGAQGGLLDRENIEVSMIDDNTLSVENIRSYGNRNVAQIIESGQGYLFDFEFNGVPRPFTEKTREELRKTDKLKNAMKKGLIREKLDVQ